MTKRIAERTLSAEEYNFSFRPNSYFNQEDPIKELLASIKGETRRKWLREDLINGLLPADFLLRENLGNDERDFLGKIHPTFMGGEYLPDRKSREVEIARFVLDSTTQDVISIRARNCGSCISYFVVDEYQTEFDCLSNNSDKPFTFGEFIYMRISSRKPINKGQRQVYPNSESSEHRSSGLCLLSECRFSQ